MIGHNDDFQEFVILSFSHEEYFLPREVIMKSLICAGADPNNKDYDGRTPLVRNAAFLLLHSSRKKN